MLKILQSVWAFISIIFRKVSPFISQHVIPAIELVNALKDVFKNPDQENEFLKMNYPTLFEVLGKISLFKNCMEKDNDFEKILSVIAKLKTQPVIVREALYLKIAAAIVKNADGNSGHSDAEIETLVQMCYLKYKKDQNEQNG